MFHIPSAYRFKVVDPYMSKVRQLNASHPSSVKALLSCKKYVALGDGKFCDQLTL